MASYRYLLNIAYIGKPFRGAQRQMKRSNIDDPLTVQGRLEMGLKQLKPSNEPVVALSSRTDSGVHAINSTCHVDLVRTKGMYDPCTVTLVLNKYFNKQNVPIRIIKTCNVPENFHCRHRAISRTYLYRLTIGKANTLNSAPSLHYIPIEEWDRCYFLCTDTFDLNVMRTAAKLLEGYHDFRTFMAKSKQREELITRKTTDYIKINETSRPGYSSYSWSPCIQSFCNNGDYIFLDVYIKSKGFLYKQVRRTVATLVAVAQGKVTIRDIKFMLEIPSHRSWCPQIKTLPAHGLYLCEVEYTKEDLDTFRNFLEA